MKTIRTEHFSLAELVYSNKATELHIDNTPTPEAVVNLCNLMTEVLEPARCKLGAPIIITSGYRCPALNNVVGGVKTSQHMMGQAADLVCTKLEDKKRLFEILKKMDIDQLLWERNSKGTQWIHVSFNQHGVNRHMIRENYVVK
jgi:hypothetical protein